MSGGQALSVVANRFLRTCKFFFELAAGEEVRVRGQKPSIGGEFESDS